MTTNAMEGTGIARGAFDGLRARLARHVPVFDGWHVRQFPNGGGGRGGIHAAYGSNYERLVEVKRRWDPGNLFRMNKNIAPPAA